MLCYTCAYLTALSAVLSTGHVLLCVVAMCCSPLNNEKRRGTFVCAGCGSALFSSDAKYNSGTGWPSFFEPIDGEYSAAEQQSVLTRLLVLVTVRVVRNTFCRCTCLNRLDATGSVRLCVQDLALFDFQPMQFPRCYGRYCSRATSDCHCGRLIYDY